MTSTRLLAAILLLAFPAVGAALADRGSSGPVATVISNQTTLTRWAYPNERGVVYEAADPLSRRMARLHPYTEDLRPEIYLALRLRTDLAGQTWVQVKLPMRQNGLVGWVKREELGPFHTVRTQLRIDRRRLRATLYRRGRAVWTSRIGVGKPGTSTPAGQFYVRERLTKYASPFYGPIAFGTSAYSHLSEWPKGGVVGIHGTSEPYLIPGRISHGCIRVPNAALRRLAALMPLGTPILIR